MATMNILNYSPPSKVSRQTSTNMTEEQDNAPPSFVNPGGCYGSKLMEKKKALQTLSNEEVYEVPPLVNPDGCYGSEFMQMEQKNLQQSLQQIEQDVTTIKSSIAQKKPKITLHQINEKLDIVISILNKWDMY